MRMRLGILVLVAAVTLTGCGMPGLGSGGKATKGAGGGNGTTTSSVRPTTTFTTVAIAPHKPVEIVSSGFATYRPPYGAGQLLSMGVLLANPNKIATAFNVSFIVATYDANNHLVDTSTQSVPYILPGERAAWGKTESNPDVTRAMFYAVTSDWVNGSPDGVISVDEVKSSNTSTSLSVFGAVSSTVNVDLDSPFAAVVFLNADGKVVGGASSTLRRAIPANGTMVAEVSLTQAPPSTKETQMYVTAKTFSSLFYK